MARKTKPVYKQLELPEGCTALYIRVSTQKQAEEGFSLASQRKELDAYCLAMGWVTCDQHVYIDAGISGKSDDRPAFQAMMVSAKAGQVQRIVATRLDRIARNLRDLLNTVYELKKHSCALVIKKEQFDTSTPQGMFVMQMLGAVGELERTMISDRVSSGRVEKATQGGFLGAPEAFGYAYSNGVFVINEGEASTVRRIFSLFLAGQSLNAIAKHLNSVEAPTKKGGKWYPVTVSKIIANGRYAGLAQWDGIEQQGEHPAIISPEVYEQAHRRLQGLRPGIQLESEIERRLQAKGL